MIQKSFETWRARVMERYYWIPQGGADPDYVIWAKEIAGITRAWTLRHYRESEPWVSWWQPATRRIRHRAMILFRLSVIIFCRWPLLQAQVLFSRLRKSYSDDDCAGKDTAEIRAAVTAELEFP
jgi:hypothetical protein